MSHVCIPRSVQNCSSLISRMCSQLIVSVNYIVFLLIILPSLICPAYSLKDDKVDRVISSEELSGFVGKDGGKIYLSILGEVYDVTSGDDFYGPGQSYSFFAGRDGTVTYFTGDFTEEGLKKQHDILDYDVKEIGAMVEWRKFYEDHETYEFVGLLAGDFYDSQGTPTKYLEDILAKSRGEEGKKSEL